MIAVPFEFWVGIGTIIGVFFFFLLWHKDMKKGKETPLSKDMYPSTKMIRCSICGAVFRDNKSKRCPTCGSYN